MDNGVERSAQEGRVPECVCVSAPPSLDGLHIIGGKQALAAVFAPPPPPGFVHSLHVPDDVTGLERELRFVPCGNMAKTQENMVKTR